MEEETESLGVKPVRRWRNRGPVVQRKAQDTHTSAREESTRESASNVLFHPFILFSSCYATIL